MAYVENASSSDPFLRVTTKGSRPGICPAQGCWAGLISAQFEYQYICVAEEHRCKTSHLCIRTEDAGSLLHLLTTVIYITTHSRSSRKLALK